MLYLMGLRSNGHQTSSAEMKWLGGGKGVGEVNHLFPPKAQVKNDCSYTPTTTYLLHPTNSLHTL